MILGYEEMYPGYGMPIMADNFEEDRYEGQDRIVEFLKTGEQVFAKLGWDTDVFTGDIIPISPVMLQSGDYRWPAILAYYVQKYNLRLPRDFEEYILKH